MYDSEMDDEDEEDIDPQSIKYDDFYVKDASRKAKKAKPESEDEEEDDEDEDDEDEEEEEEEEDEEG